MEYKYAHPEFFDGVPRPDFKSLSGNLVIYGAGFQGLLTAYLLDQQGIEVLCFGDQDVKKQGTTYYNLPVYSPEEMKQRYPDAVVIVTPYNIRPAFQYVRDDLGYGEQVVTPFSLFLEFDSSGFDEQPELPDWYQVESLDYYIRAFLKQCINLQTDKSFLCVDISVTEVCNLRCKNCTSFMPCYTKPRHFDFEDVMRDVQTVLQERMFHDIFLEGGEPFLWKPLPELIWNLCAAPNIMNVVPVTNGTVIPDLDLLMALQNPKVTVRISNYGEISKKDELIRLFKKYNIKYWLQLQRWYELSSLHKNPLSREQIKTVVSDCCKAGGNGSRHIADGKLYICPLQANLHKLKIFESEEKDYVNLRMEDSALLQKRISDFLDMKKMPSIPEICLRCNGRGYSGVEVPPAQQLAPGETIQVRFE